MRFLIPALCLLTACGLHAERRIPGEAPGLPVPGDDAFSWEEIGRSVEDRPIHAVRFGTGGQTTLIFAGIHGDEKVAVGTALRLCRELDRNRVLLQGRRVVVVPILNPDGWMQGRRKNARCVDLNRNFPTRNWGASSLRKGDTPGAYPGSEPETRALLSLMKRETPAKVLSLHAPARMNNHDGPAGRPMALAMASFNGYPVRGDIGYPTPGSFGTWAGKERGIPTVTLEIPDGTAAQRWEENRWALLAAIRHDPGEGATAAEVRGDGTEDGNHPGR